MKALVINGLGDGLGDRHGTIALRDVAAPEPIAECRIRVRLAGICGTDLQLTEGYADFRGIPGHEFVGVVETAPVDDAAWIGKRVVGEINVGCGRCEWCESGVREHCVNRTVVGIRGRDGAFAEMLALPAANLHEIPDTLDDETAVFVEPTAAACRILEQIALDDSARVGVIGDGRMGLIIAQVLRTVTPAVTVIGRHDNKLDLARSLGLTALLSEASIRPAARYDVVVDVTGRPDGIRRAIEIVRPRGTVVMKSTFHGEAALATWPIVVDEVTLVGSRCGPFRRAVDVLASGAVQVKPLISWVTDLDDYQAAFARARSSFKVLFRF
jgi:threonine dehydrogenase-like Zn-dependent dehydrogenase